MVILKHHNSLTSSLNTFENADSNLNMLQALKERSTLYRLSLLDVLNHSDRFTELAEFLTNKLTNVLESKRDEKFENF